MTAVFCVLYLGFSGGTNQQSQALKTALDKTDNTAEPEMNGKQDGSMDDFHRMIVPVLSLLSNTASIYLKKEDGGPILNDPNLEEDSAKVFCERCGCPTDLFMLYLLFYKKLALWLQKTDKNLIWMKITSPLILSRKIVKYLFILTE
jgi:hypothetical protein